MSMFCNCKEYGDLSKLDFSAKEIAQKSLESKVLLPGESSLQSKDIQSLIERLQSNIFLVTSNAGKEFSVVAWDDIRLEIEKWAECIRETGNDK